MSTQSGLGNGCVSCQQSNESRARILGPATAIFRSALAFSLAIVLSLATVGLLDAASGTPWHSQTDSLTGEALPVWELWSKALDSETWVDVEQLWVAVSLPWLIAPHPANPNAALAAGAPGVYRTLDGGETWTHLPGIVDPVIAIAYSAQNPRIVYAGTELSGTFRSESGGLYWRSIDSGLPQDRLGHVAGAVALAADPVLSGTLYAAATTAGGLYRSQDSGASWLLANSGLPEESILGLTVTESAPARLYAVLAGGLYLSHDRAETWSLIGAAPTETLLELLLEPDALGALLVVAETALYRTTNGGVTWVSLDIPAEMPPIRDAMFVAGGEYTYLFVASENGAFWQRITPVSPQSPPQVESEEETYVAVTGHTVREPFLSYFNANGGVARFGYPRTDAIDENEKTVQYFQRARLEIVTEEGGERVVQSPLGRIRLTGVDPATAAAQSQSSAAQEQYAVGQEFINYYASNNGREAFGNPIAPAADEVQLNGVTLFTQYFEFARLEYHPQAETPVLLGLIGDEYLIQKGWLE